MWQMSVVLTDMSCTVTTAIEAVDGHTCFLLLTAATNTYTESPRTYLMSSSKMRLDNMQIIISLLETQMLLWCRIFLCIFYMHRKILIIPWFQNISVCIFVCIYFDTQVYIYFCMYFSDDVRIFLCVFT